MDFVLFMYACELFLAFLEGPFVKFCLLDEHIPEFHCLVFNSCSALYIVAHIEHTLSDARQTYWNVYRCEAFAVSERIRSDRCEILWKINILQ